MTAGGRRAFILRLAAAAAVAATAAVFVALNVVQRGGVSPLPAMLGKVGHFALGLFFWWSVYAVGRGAERLVWRRRVWPADVAATLGIVALVLLAVGACALRVAYAWPARVFVAGAGVAGAVLLRRDWLGWRERLGSWLRGLELSSAALLAGTFVVLLPFALTAFEPPYSWDTLTYHLVIPRAYAAAHGFTYLPFNVYASMPLGATLFYLWPYLWDGLIAANAAQVVASLLAASLTWRLARLWLPPFYAWLAAAFLLLTPVFATALGAAGADHFQTAFIAAALWCYFGARGRGDAAPARWPLAAGVFLGAALAVKYAAYAAAAAFIPVWAYDLVKKNVRLRQLAVVAGVAAAFLVPWLVKAYAERGNAVFPLLYGVFGGRDFSAAQNERLVAWQLEMGLGRGVADFLLTPYRIAVAAGTDFDDFCGIYLPFLLPLAAAALLLWRRGRALAAYGWFYLVAWWWGPQQLRFLDGALPALAAAAAGTAAWAESTTGWLRRVWRALLVAGTVAVAFSQFAGAAFNTLPGHLYLLGMTRDDFLLGHCGFYGAQLFINRRLPEDAVVLMLFSNHTLYLERRAIYDSFPEASAFLLAAETAAGPADLYRLARRWGATHVHVYRDNEPYVLRHYAPRARANLDAFVRTYGAPVYEDEYNAVYELVEAPR